MTNLPSPGRVLVTGAAGFIGSHVCDALLAAGDEVVGVDCFTDYYARAAKERNVAHAREWDSFELLAPDLARAGLAGLLAGIAAVIHLAGHPGVRERSREAVHACVERNVVATERLLRAVAGSPLASFVYASSSSVYGDAPTVPTGERAPTRPVSAYGVTKVAAERLAQAYARRHGVPAVGLRYFTVYGPRQRPDMAFARFIARCVAGEPIELLGDGRQVRDFTYVGDAVAGTLAAAARGRPGAVYNIGGGHPVELLEAIALIGEFTGTPVTIERRPAVPGEAHRTACDGALARRELGFEPRTPLAAGVAEQLAHVAGARAAPLARA
jgi:nucleoside-diphosphate-sugar epimerase